MAKSTDAKLKVIDNFYIFAEDGQWYWELRIDGVVRAKCLHPFTNRRNAANDAERFRYRVPAAETVEAGL